MYHIDADIPKNRLIIRVTGMMGVEEVTEAGQKLMAAVARLKPGFDCINDLSEAKPASQEVADRLGKIQAAVAKAGMRRVVRVVLSRLTAMQFDRTAAGLPYQVFQADSIDAAQQLLDQPAAE